MWDLNGGYERNVTGTDGTRHEIRLLCQALEARCGFCDDNYCGHVFLIPRL